MCIPDLHTAEELLKDAGQRNPGPWVAHSRLVAQAAAAIAAAVASGVAAPGSTGGPDPGAAYILGLLHDIGRREGVTQMRHAIDGYAFLHSLGYKDAARVCLTHSFPRPDPQYSTGEWDCSPEEFQFVSDFLSKSQYDDYDRLVQLCDALSLPEGYCLIEKRLIDVTLRYGFNSSTLEKWNAIFEIQRGFEARLGKSVYTLLPGVVRTTFGYDPCPP